MATAALSPLPRVRALARGRERVLLPLGVLALTLLSLLPRTAHLDTGFWVDEGLSYGIADRPLFDIPGTMRQDGSPPLYYMLLHGWMRALDVRGVEPLHLLSVLFAAVAVPVAFVLGRSLFGTRGGWAAAVLIAVNPYLTEYAQENRMYSLVVLLSLTAVGLFLGAFALERGRVWAVAYGAAHAVLLYTHNWGLFLGAGLAAAWVVLVVLATGERRRALVRDGIVAFAVVAVLYAPWVPTLLFQTAHTGAPWANPPDAHNLYEVPGDLMGFSAQFLLIIGAGAGLATLVRGPVRRWPAEGRAALALLIAGVLAVLVPWTISQSDPAWALRYLAVGVGPLVLFCALGLARAGRLGIAVLALVALLCFGQQGRTQKSNIASVAAVIGPSLRPGDLVVSTQPEQVPVAHYYLAKHVRDLRWATVFGPTPDLGVTDWRDGTERLEATSVRGDLVPLLDTVEAGQRVVLLAPDFAIGARWRAPWSALVKRRTVAWGDAMRNDPRFRVITVEPPKPLARPNEVQATIFVRQPLASSPTTSPAGGALLTPSPSPSP